MDLLRACYEANFRFYRDTDERTTVQWYFVPRDRPWLPHPTVFSSYNWDEGPHSGAKGYCRGTVVQGEQVDSPRPFRAGLIPPDEPRPVHFCGTASQWAGDLVLARDGTMITNEHGWPVCCDPAPLPPPPPPGPFIWLRAEDSIPPFTHGTIWEGFQQKGQAIAQAAGFVGPIKLTEDGITFVRLQQAFDSQPPPGAWHRGFFVVTAAGSSASYTAYLVARPVSAPPAFGLFPFTDYPIKVDADRWGFKRASTLLQVFQPLASGWQVWQLKKGNGILSLSHMGLVQAVVPEPPGQLPLGPMGFDLSAGLTGLAQADVAELLVFPFAQDVEEEQEVYEYLRTKFGVPPL